MSARKLKKQVLDLLATQDLDTIHDKLARLKAKDVVNVLFSGICCTEETVRWHAVSAMGKVVSRLADEDMEEARIIMRRLLWSLNDESGGIGWGVPETMAEIMSNHAGIAGEYVHMLISYMREDGEEICQDGNFLELESLQRGLMWGVGRMAVSCRDLMLEKMTDRDLPPYLESEDASVRGLAARAIGLLGLPSRQDRLEELSEDSTPVRLYDNGVLTTVTVGELADQAIQRLAD